MAGKRRPMEVNLSVVGSGTGKHWTKAEIEDRRSSEIKTKKPKAITPPGWLSKGGKTLFRKYAKLLLEFPEGMVSKLDVGTLARYCDCELSYGDASCHKNVWMETAGRRLGDLSAAAAMATPDQILQLSTAYDEARDMVDFWASQMVKFEKIARSCATEMGMTISSRCKLVVPQVEKPVEDNPLDELRRRYAK